MSYMAAVAGVRGVQLPEVVPGAYPAGVLDDLPTLVEQLRSAVLPLALSAGCLRTTAYLFCSRNPITDEPGDVLLQTSAGPSDPADTEIPEDHQRGFAKVVRAACHYGHAHGAAFLTGAILAARRQGDPDHPPSLMDLSGRTDAVPSLLLTVVRRDQPTQIWVAPMRLPVPPFRQMRNPNVALVGIIGAAFAHCLDPLVEGRDDPLDALHVFHSSCPAEPEPEREPWTAQRVQVPRSREAQGVAANVVSFVIAERLRLGHGITVDATVDVEPHGGGWRPTIQIMIEGEPAGNRLTGEASATKADAERRANAVGHAIADQLNAHGWRDRPDPKGLN